MTALAKTPTYKVGRSLKVLVPLIQNELTAAHAAGLEYYRRVGEMLIEAKDQVSYGSWGKWLNKNFDLSDKTARDYMRLARQTQNGTGGAEVAPQSLRQARGDTERERKKRATWKPLFKQATAIDQEDVARQQLRREISNEMIDLGYRALAMRHHPDRGGSKEKMTLTNEVKKALTEKALQKVIQMEREEEEANYARADSRSRWLKKMVEIVDWIETFVHDHSDLQLKWYTENGPGLFDHGLTPERIQSVINALERVRVETFGGNRRA